MKKNTILMLIMIVAACGSARAQAVAAKPLTVLEVNRKRIDSLDSKIIETIALREKLAKEIGEYKAKNKIPALQTARFQEVLNNAVKDGVQQGLSEEFITELMNAIHRESLRIESKAAHNSN
ncbi:chorismate mutase [Pedobacter sp. AK013]|uniref:chorismate mutase n=1 Tax=Pedobacter sp. AK013 TaxID=2723071 RepID=UPI0016123FDD|nr:chorismate mutase [Pedobacter sp. AK013]MBB6239302.1 chorismate mutase [Pedobacter sp. AK013]